MSVHPAISKGFTRVLALALVLTWAACDGSEDPSDVELIVGQWDLAGVTDSVGDQLATFNTNFSSFEANFDNAGNVTIELVSATGGSDINVAATYTLDEGNGSVNMTTVVSGVPVTIPFGYSFTNDDTLVLTASALLLQQVLQTALTGSATITLTRQP